MRGPGMMQVLRIKQTISYYRFEQLRCQREIEEGLKAKEANLKFLINYPEGKELTLQAGLFSDTLETAAYTSCVEYQQLQAQLRLQEANVKYNKWSYSYCSANGSHIRNL